MWAPTGLLATTRKRLRAFDPYVDLWWCQARKRWKLMEFSRSQVYWSTICYWVGAHGEYREPAPADAMLRLLWSKDVTRTGKSLADLAKDCEAKNHKLDEKRKDTAVWDGGRESMDYAMSASGARLTIPMPGSKKD